MQNKYSNSKIYKLTSSHTNNIYIGSTTMSLCKRFNCHKSDYRRLKYVSYCELLLYQDCKIELIEIYPCETKQQLLKREGYYIDNFRNIVVNIHTPGQTSKERRTKSGKDIKYRENHREEIRERDNIWYEKNKDIKNTKRKEQILCDKCNILLNKGSKSQHQKSKKHINNSK